MHLNCFKISKTVLPLQASIDKETDQAFGVQDHGVMNYDRESLMKVSLSRIHLYHSFFLCVLSFLRGLLHRTIYFVEKLTNPFILFIRELSLIYYMSFFFKNW